MKVVYKEDWFVLRAIIDKFCNKWFRGTKRQKYPERTLVFDIAFSELLLTKLLSSAGKYATLSFVSYEFKQLSHRFFSFPEAKYSLETILKLLNKPSWGHLFFSSLSFFLFFFFLLSGALEDTNVLATCTRFTINYTLFDYSKTGQLALLSPESR